MNINKTSILDNGSHNIDAKLRAKYESLKTNLKATFRSGKSKTHAWRIAQLKAMKRLLTENEGAIKEAMAADLGRGYFEAVGLEIVPMMMEIDYAIQHLETWMKPVYTPVPAMIAPAVSEYVYEPYGVVLIIGSFNYPILLSLSPLIGALLAGNCAVLKPSEVSKASEKLMVELLPRYLDTECVAVVTGGVETNTALLDLAWDKIMFTGSTRVGRIVAMAAAKHLTPVTLELGGKSPTIVDASCTNLELAARRIVWGKISNAGQTCIAPDYVLCHVSKYDAFMAAAVKVRAVSWWRGDGGRWAREGHLISSPPISSPSTSPHIPSSPLISSHLLSPHIPSSHLLSSLLSPLLRTDASPSSPGAEDVRGSPLPLGFSLTPPLHTPTTHTGAEDVRGS